MMTGDDHAFGGTAGRFDQYKAASPAGCSVVLWDCVRGTSYIFPNSPLTNAQATQYVSEGFEVSVHVSASGGLDCLDWTPTSLTNVYSTQLQQFRVEVHGRSGACHPSSPLRRLGGLGDSAQGRARQRNPLRHELLPLSRSLDRFAPRLHDRLGHGHALRRHERRPDRRLSGPHAHGRRGAAALPGNGQLLAGWSARLERFLRHLHSEHAHGSGRLSGVDAIVASALSRGVPIVSAKQMLDWVDGRNNSSLRDLTWSNNTLTLQRHPGIGRDRLADDAPSPERRKNAVGHHEERLAGLLHDRDDQGNCLRALPLVDGLIRSRLQAVDHLHRTLLQRISDQLLHAAGALRASR